MKTITMPGKKIEIGVRMVKSQTSQPVAEDECNCVPPTALMAFSLYETGMYGVWSENVVILMSAPYGY